MGLNRFVKTKLECFDFFPEAFFSNLFKSDFFIWDFMYFSKKDPQKLNLNFLRKFGLEKKVSINTDWLVFFKKSSSELNNKMVCQFFL